MKIFNQILLALATVWVTSAPVSAAMEDHSAVETGIYLNGGIGIDGRHAMRAQSKHYNLRLTFAEARSGEYLADVDVTINSLGSKEEPVYYADCGPLFYIKLHPGRYHIIAEYRGKKHSLTTVVGAKGAEHVMYWP